MGISTFIARIKRRETPFYDRLFRIAKRIRLFEAPYVRGWHDILYYERSFRINAWRTLWRIFYYQPLFRSRCASCGDNLHIYHSGQGLPCIEGDLGIFVGDNVKLYDHITLASLTIARNPRLVIGDGTDISTPVSILVGNEIEIGSNCMIGCTLITDNPGHRVEYFQRDEKLDADRIGRVKIGDYVWAAMQSIIVGNVSVGFGAVIGARAVVTRDVPPFCVVTGNPAKIVKKLEFPEDMIDTLGEDEYRKYLDVTVGG